MDVLPSPKDQVNVPLEPALLLKFTVPPTYDPPVYDIVSTAVVFLVVVLGELFLQAATTKTASIKKEQ